MLALQQFAQAASEAEPQRLGQEQHNRQRANQFRAALRPKEKQRRREWLDHGHANTAPSAPSAPSAPDMEAGPSSHELQALDAESNGEQRPQGPQEEPKRFALIRAAFARVTLFITG